MTLDDEAMTWREMAARDEARREAEEHADYLVQRSIDDGWEEAKWYGPQNVFTFDPYPDQDWDEPSSLPPASRYPHD
jgi:hypothetical protein